MSALPRRRLAAPSPLPPAVTAFCCPLLCSHAAFLRRTDAHDRADFLSLPLPRPSRPRRNRPHPIVITMRRPVEDAPYGGSLLNRFLRSPASSLRPEAPPARPPRPLQSTSSTLVHSPPLALRYNLRIHSCAVPRVPRRLLEEFLISEEGTLQDAALSALPLFTIGQVRRAILSGAVTISGRRASPDAPVVPGDVLTVDLDAAGAPKIELVARDFAVLFEDDSLLVLDKPAGVANVPERGADTWPLMGMLLYHAAGCPLCRPAPRFRIPQFDRLDRDTSGVVAVAKTPAAQRALTAMFAGREVDKRYLAIVSGEPASDEGTIDAPLAPASRPKGAMEVRSGGKPSTTAWRVVERFRGFALLEARPLTGRTHQIRVHLAYAGMPLAVDPLYSGADALSLSSIKRYGRRTGEERPLISRLTLHCSSLSFAHPITSNPLTLEAPLPPIFPLPPQIPPQMGCPPLTRLSSLSLWERAA